MKNLGLVISAIIFFLLINTSYFWESKLGILSFPALLLLFTIYFVFIFLLLRQVYLAYKEGFSSKSRFVSIGLLAIVLALTSMKPHGLINFEKFEGKDLLIAQREGSANCMITLKLKENNKFIERSVCFGITEINGNYELKNDTIFFKDVELGRHAKEYFKFAVIRPSVFFTNESAFDFVRYRNKKDTLGNELWIVKNELTK